MEKITYRLENGEILTFKRPDESLKIEKYLNNSVETKISTKENIK